MIPRSALVVVMLTLTLTGFQNATGSARAPAPTGIAPCDTNRFMMTMTRGVLEVIHVYPGATADTSTPPIRSLRGEHTTLCRPHDLAVDTRGRLHVMSSNIISVFEAGAAGDAEPIEALEIPAMGIGLDRRDNTYVATWESSPPSDSGSILVFGRGAAGERRPSRMLAGPRTGLRRPYGVAVDAEGRIYVTTENADTVRIFGRGASGDVAPVAFLAGTHTRLNHPSGLGFDRHGWLYVANTAGSSVTVYPPRSSGDVAPVRTIEAQPGLQERGFNGPRFLAFDSHDTLYVTANRGVFVFSPEAAGKVSPARRLIVPEHHGLAVGRDGTLYVANRSGRVSVFAPGASDSAAPVRVIEDLPDERGALGVALGTADTLYVADIDATSVRVYRPGARWAAAPVRSLSGPRTRLSDPRGIVVDRRGTLYVANGPQRATRGAIRIYAPNTTDSAMPVRVIRGGQTKLARPSDVAIDRRGYIYAVNRGEPYTSNPDGSVTAYAPDAKGDAEPIRRIAGPNTLLREPIGLAIGPGDTLYVLNAFGGTGLGPTWKYGTGNVSITVYSPSSNGDVEPIRTIAVTGGQTVRGGRFPTGIAVDARGSVFYADYGSKFVVVYAPGAGGRAVPTRQIRLGPTVEEKPLWSYLGGLAIASGPGDELFVAAFPQQRVFTWRGPSSNAKKETFAISPPGSAAMTRWFAPSN